MGRWKRRSRPGLWAPVAFLVRSEWEGNWPTFADHRHDQTKSRLQAHACDFLEPGWNRPDGFASMSLPVPVLCSGREALLSALPTQRWRLPGRPVQHCVLRAPHYDDRAGLWPRTRWIRSHYWRHAHLPEPFRTGGYPARPRAQTASSDAAQPWSEVHLRLQIRRLHYWGLRSLAADQGSCCCVNSNKKCILQKTAMCNPLCGFCIFKKFYATVNQNFILQFSLSNVSEWVSPSVLPSEISMINASFFKKSQNSLTIFFISSLSDW